MFFGIEYKYWILLAGLAFTIWKHFDTKNKELTWKKAEAILDLGHKFDSDPDIIQALKIIEGRDAITLDKLYDSQGKPQNSIYPDELQKIDKLLNFLDRIAYAVETAGTLTLTEAKNFGGYYELILEKSRLTKYCDINGFHDIVALAKKI